jgi:hypothetical protein
MEGGVMRVTEDEAKVMWCPFVRQTAEGMGSFNRGGSANPLNSRHSSGDYSCACLASKCMAWKWDSQAGASGVGYCGLTSNS